MPDGILIIDKPDGLDEHGRVPPHAVADRAGTPLIFHPRRK